MAIVAILHRLTLVRLAQAHTTGLEMDLQLQQVQAQPKRLSKLAISLSPPRLKLGEEARSTSTTLSRARWVVEIANGIALRRQYHSGRA